MTTWPILTAIIALGAGVGLAVALVISASVDLARYHSVEILLPTFGASLVPLAIGLVVGWRALRELLLARSNSAATVGLITDASLRSNLSSEGHTTQFVRVTIAYEVAGTRHSITHDPQIGSHNTMSAHERVLKRYARGTTLPVYYDPRFPERASTKRHPGLVPFVLGAVLIAVAGAGIGVGIGLALFGF